MGRRLEAARKWKAKCLEKALHFTCAMCRGTVMVVTAGAGGASA